MIAGVWVVNSDCWMAAGLDTANVALAPLSPEAEAVIVAVPVDVGVKVDCAVPPVAATEAPGLNDPDTPLAKNVTVLVADAMVLPLASWMLAV